jgi:hypothetical protein
VKILRIRTFPTESGGIEIDINPDQVTNATYRLDKEGRRTSCIIYYANGNHTSFERCELCEYIHSFFEKFEEQV